MMVCAICGKKIFTTYPDNWPYRYKSKVFCSQDCKIVHTARDLHKVDFANLGLQDMSGFYPYEIPVREGKTEEEGDEDMRGQKLLTDEQKQKAVEIALEGGDPIKYLNGLGMKNPWGNWGYIKMKLKEKEPEKYDQLMKAMKDKGEAKEKKMKQQRETLEKMLNPEKVLKVDRLPEEVQTIGKTVSVEKKNGGVEVKVAMAPGVNLEEILNQPKKSRKVNLVYKVIGIETKLGKFQYDRASDQMRWMPKNSTVVIMLQAEDWKQLAEDLPGIMETIGASSREEDDE